MGDGKRHVTAASTSSDDIVDVAPAALIGGRSFGFTAKKVSLLIYVRLELTPGLVARLSSSTALNY